MTTADDPITHRARTVFEAQVNAMDGPTATALRTRRRDALSAGPRRRPLIGWWSASGIATAALAVALWLPSAEGPMPDPAPTPKAGTVEAIATDAAGFAEAALVELDDDAEFYVWLATVPDDSLDADAAALPAQDSQEGWTL